MTPGDLLAVAVACSLIGAGLGSWKNQWWRGAIAGFILGPLGLLIMLVIPVSDNARARRAEARLRAEAEARRRIAGDG
jgi:hypothetical protein